VAAAAGGPSGERREGGNREQQARGMPRDGAAGNPGTERQAPPETGFECRRHDIWRPRRGCHGHIPDTRSRHVANNSCKSNLHCVIPRTARRGGAKSRRRGVVGAALRGRPCRWARAADGHPVKVKFIASSGDRRARACFRRCENLRRPDGAEESPGTGVLSALRESPSPHRGEKANKGPGPFSVLARRRGMK
jgi:hypothetical protein